MEHSLLVRRKYALTQPAKTHSRGRDKNASISISNIFKSTFVCETMSRGEWRIFLKECKSWLNSLNSEELEALDTYQDSSAFINSYLREPGNKNAKFDAGFKSLQEITNNEDPPFKEYLRAIDPLVAMASSSKAKSIRLPFDINVFRVVHRYDAFCKWRTGRVCVDPAFLSTTHNPRRVPVEDGECCVLCIRVPAGTSMWSSYCYEDSLTPEEIILMPNTRLQWTGHEQRSDMVNEFKSESSIRRNILFVSMKIV